MNRRYIKIITSLLLFCTCWISMEAQSVIFPQQQQPGTAVGTVEGTTYTLKNDLFTVTFVKNGTSLNFGGCPQMELQSGTDLFKITLGDGTTVTDKQMTLTDVKLETLTGDPGAVKGSHRFNGYALKATYTYNNMTLVWTAILRDGSHYLRTKLDMTTSADVQMKSVVPMIYQVEKTTGGTMKVVGNTRGAVLASDKLFAGLESPMGINRVYAFYFDRWNSSSFTNDGHVEIPQGITKRKTLVEETIFGIGTGNYAEKGKPLTAQNVRYATGWINIQSEGNYKFTFNYTKNSGSHQLNIAGVDVIDETGKVMGSDYHCGFAGKNIWKNVYNLKGLQPGTYLLRYFVEVATEPIESSGTIAVSPNKISSDNQRNVQFVEGKWSRNTTLLKDDPNIDKLNESWSISSVIGFIAPGQARRSILAYSERERAVPWRPMPIYNSWYELNIDRNNAADPTQNMTTEQTTPILQAWKTNLFDKNGVGIKSFVWDDGWDNYKTWECHAAFDFTKPAATAAAMGAGTGVWLGPVGGYGVSGDTRRAYWNAENRGGMKLSNPKYYTVFYNAVTNFVTQHKGNYFKLDGISKLETAYGPDDSPGNPTGEEDAEAIIALESHIRSLKPDIFLNTSVGTWASPFWFRYTDAVWRQLGDYGEAGDHTSDREKWITYRDQLVYQHFVQESPLCPINTMMVHGIILTTRGAVSKNMDHEGIVREMRCAFASGNAMVELYCDHDLLTKYDLWGELAECIRWQERNADVLPDIHWVGGNPWDGKNENVYGWASWNGWKATLALRNGDTQEKTFVTTLRDALEIPSYVTGTMTFERSFSRQAALTGLPVGQPIDIDTQLSLTLPASSVYVFDGIQDGKALKIKVDIKPSNNYATCILPFDAALPRSLQAYSCDAVNGDLLVMTKESSLKADTPYILYSPTGVTEYFTGPVDVANLCTEEMTRGYLTGVYHEKTLNAGTNSYVLQNQKANLGVRFYSVDSPKTVPAYKCFLTVPGGKVNAFRFEGDVTGLTTILQEKGDAPVYDLSGRRVWQTIPGHIYLSNGRKFIAK